MSNTLKLIERIRSTTETGTDYAVAKALGITQSNLIEIKKGKRWPGPKAQVRMSELLKIELKDIVAFIGEDKATSEAERLHWRSLCSESVRSWLDAATKTAACFILATLIFPGKNAEASVDKATVASYESMYYAYQRSTWRKRLMRWFATLRGCGGLMARRAVPAAA